MKPRFRAEWVVVSEELLILASCLLRPMSRNSVLEELSVRRFAIWYFHTLTFHQHIAVLVTKSARSFYALKTIRTNGLNGNALWDVTRATLVSQLLYASPAWWGYIKADERNRLQSIIVKAIRYGYLPRSFSTIDELREDSDDKLFFSARYNPNHVLRRLLPQPKTIEHNLRQRTHNLTLPMDVNATVKQNFVYRMLFRDIY